MNFGKIMKYVTEEDAEEAIYYVNLIKNANADSDADITKCLQYIIVSYYKTFFPKLAERVTNRMEENAPKNFVAFTITMPQNGSWNGVDTGAGFHCKVLKKSECQKVKEGNYCYSWEDGWVACVNVHFINAKEAKRIRKESQGFRGYDHFIKEIIQFGKIINKPNK